MKRILSYGLAILLSSSLGLRAQETEDEKEESELLNQLEGLLEEAKLSEILEDRKRLQDLDLGNLPEAGKVLADELKKLQEDGVIIPEAVRKAVEGGLEGKEELGNASDLLGPAPEKGKKFGGEEVGEWFLIENSNFMVIDQKTGVMVAEGDVLVTNKDPGVEKPFRLRCDKLVAHAEINDKGNRDLSYAKATGRMVVINGFNDQGDPIEVRCKKAVLEGDKIFLRGWPELSMPGRLMKAKDKDAYIEASTGKDSKFTPKGAFEIKLKKKPDDA